MNQNRRDSGRSNNYNRVDRRYHSQYSYQRNRRSTSRRRSGLREYGPVLLIATVIAVSGLFVLANSLGLFNVTQGKPGNNEAVSGVVASVAESSNISASGTDTVSSGSSAAPTPTPSPASTAESSLPAGLPEYAYLYPELNQPKPVPKPREENVIYLTIDDGPCKSTGKLLDTLDQVGIKVVFYVTAQYGSDEDIVEQMKEIHKRGHKVEVHTYSHDYKDIYSSVDAFLKDFKKMDDLIYEATGERSKTFRFPGGSNTGYNEKIRDALLTEMSRRGYVYYDWNASNGDSDGYSPDKFASKVVGECSVNSWNIVLMHNTPGKDESINTLPDFVNQLQQAGYTFKLLDETVPPLQFKSPPKPADEKKPEDTGNSNTESTKQPG